MPSKYQSIIQKAYTGFNARDIDKTLSKMHPDVNWPKASEGGYVISYILS